MNLAAPVTPRVLRLHADDDVLIAVDRVDEGQPLAEGIVALRRIPRGHKAAARPIAKGQPVRKFGQIIGVATADIAPGDWVHEHNLGMADFDRDPAYGADLKPFASLPVETFEGFRRDTGKVGTRNFIGILTSVNCSATVARFMAEEITRSGVLADYPNVDGVIALTHGGGCALDVGGEGYEVLKRTQWGYAANPNMAAVVMVGLGCEGFQIARFKEFYGITESDRFRSMTIQEVGGTRRTVDQGMGVIREMLPMANAARRQTVPASELTVALQCGGSDGYSGITANPALGVASDILVAQGGTTVLAETPEIYGAEHLLTRRAVSREVGEKLMARIRWWEDYTARNRMAMNNNPSPGNKQGGLTTILEKSLGAAAKGGSAPLSAVWEYAEPVTTHGFTFMDSPGYDPVSITGQVAGGCNLVAFTTGRGSAYGCKPAPSIKLATNTQMFEKMTDDMDVNCGDVLDGVSLADKGREIFDLFLRVASGERTKSEQLGYGDAEFVPWTIGATM
jgi:altronate hydrolase